MSAESTKQANEMYWRFNATGLHDRVAGGSDTAHESRRRGSGSPAVGLCRRIADCPVHAGPLAASRRQKWIDQWPVGLSGWNLRERFRALLWKARSGAESV